MLNSTRNFFELVRIDFLIDEDFNPHLTEVNMSPGFSAPMGEQVIYHTMKLVGASSSVDLMSM